MGKVLSKTKEVLAVHYGCTEKRKARHKTWRQTYMVQNQLGKLVSHSVSNVQRNHVIRILIFNLVHITYMHFST